MEIVEKTATVTSVESENPNGEFEVVLSTEALDRDGENLWANEWKMPLPERIHIDGDHGRTLEKTVGSAVPRIEENRMVAKGTYAGTEYAQMVRQLVNEGHIGQVSVTYGERKGQKDAKPERELFNAAFVAIPANAECVVLSSKSAKEDGGVPTVINNVVKAAGGFGASGNNPKVDPADMMQAIHDAACHLGAMCPYDPGADSGAADGANKAADPQTSSTKDAGEPQESAEESAAAEPAAKAAGSAAAEESADDAARLSLRARSLQFLINQNSCEE